MTGLKSGSGDDLWGDESDKEEQETEVDEDAATTEESASIEGSRTDETESLTEDTETNSSGNETHPYVVRRAIKNKSVQYERDERLTFFVHDDVANGERKLITELESVLGRNVPKFDVREAVYRAALRNPDDVLDELVNMGYSLDQEEEE